MTVRTAPDEQTTNLPNAGKIRHEEFCLPRPGEVSPRIEGFPAMVDDEKTGRSVVRKFVTRCMECGAAHYEDKEK